MASELAVPIPDGPLERERELVTSTPSLDLDEFITVQATQRDRSRPPPAAGAPQERDRRDRRTTTLELLPYSSATRKLAAPGSQPRRMRLGGLMTGRRAAQLARQRLAGRARTLSPATRNVEDLPRTRVLARRIPIRSAASARRHPAARARLIQSCTAVAHRRSPALAPRPWAPFWSPFFWRELTFDDSPWRKPGCAQTQESPAPAAI